MNIDILELVKQFGVSATQDLILSNGEAEWCYLFAFNVKGADVGLLEEAVVRSDDEYYINKFRKLV